jgi:hypothetical protein
MMGASVLAQGEGLGSRPGLCSAARLSHSLLPRQSEKRPTGPRFFSAQIPLLSYNMRIVPKFAGFIPPSPRSRSYVALQRAHV